jgi:plasmid stability protein
MSSLLQIRNVPDDVRRVLKARAAERGESLNSYLLDLLEREAARPSVREVLDRAAGRAERSAASSLTVIDAARAERAGGRRPPR